MCETTKSTSAHVPVLKFFGPHYLDLRLSHTTSLSRPLHTAWVCLTCLSPAVNLYARSLKPKKYFLGVALAGVLDCRVSIAPYTSTRCEAFRLPTQSGSSPSAYHSIVGQLSRQQTTRTMSPVPNSNRSLDAVLGAVYVVLSSRPRTSIEASDV